MARTFTKAIQVATKRWQSIRSENPQILAEWKTDEGLNLKGKRKTLEYMSEWAKEMCEIHNIDPGNMLNKALEQQLVWHEHQTEQHKKHTHAACTYQSTVG